FDMPHAFELPRMLRAVIPLVRAHLARIHEFVALAFGHALRAFQLRRAAAGRVPGFSAIIGTLDDLAEPTARLRRVNPVRVRGRTFDMVNFPTREMRAADFPFLALAIRSKNERTLLCADQDSDFAHRFPLVGL